MEITQDAESAEHDQSHDDDDDDVDGGLPPGGHRYLGVEEVEANASDDEDDDKLNDGHLGEYGDESENGHCGDHILCGYNRG